MMKKTFLFAGRAAALSTLVVALTASALQTVVPVKDTAGTAYTGSGAAWTGTAGLGTVVTVIGRYTTDNPTANESGLGLKVVYDEAKFTGVTVTPLITNCMIAPPQIQPSGAATKAVLGWIDTAARNPAGSVGWPYLADPATSTVAPITSPCLSPNTPANNTAANPAGAVNLFQFRGTLAPAVGVGGTATVQFLSEGNFSYASTTPGMADQTLTITAAPAPSCNLDIDLSGGVNGGRSAFVDGILIVRHLLNLTNTTLTNNLTITGTRNQPSDLTAYMAGINWDMTGAGAQSAFRDGIILVRLMLNIPDATLLNGVTIPAGATFQTAAQIRANVNSKCGTTF